MKKVLSLLAVILFLTGCEDATQSFISMKQVYPDSEIVAQPGAPYHYFVRKSDGQVIYVREDGSDHHLSGEDYEVIIFEANQ